MLLPLAAIAVGFLIGFVGSRKLRRPQHAAQAASVARTVSGSVGRRRTLTAPELQRACFSEMVRHVRVDRQGRTRAPSRYLLQVNPVDLEVIDDTRSWFVDGLRDALVTAAKDNGWTLEGTPEVRVEADPSKRAGVPGATALDPVEAERPQRAEPAGLVLVRSDDGARTPLSGRVSIGRASERTFTI
ncbi:MAG: hypothetical protein JWO77_1077, partial [Ilumatobacteraceae bacterium]|nr:hypothetical protein [Ilumatobacteraceae bacterium]